MNELDRRSLLKAISAVPFACCEALSLPGQEPVSAVASHTDRTAHPHQAARANSHLDFKVLTRETDNRVFIMENRDMVRGGPPRHVHYEQAEWFFFLEGSEVLLEIGDQKIRLKPGDSLLAPRNVPHVWAYLGGQPGPMVFVFTPAAKIESSFEETSKLDGKGWDPQRSAAYGMKMLGPPLLD